MISSTEISSVQRIRYWSCNHHAIPTAINVGPSTTELLVMRSEEHTSELQSHRDLHSFPTRRSSDLTEISSVQRIRYWSCNHHAIPTAINVGPSTTELLVM